MHPFLNSIGMVTQRLGPQLKFWLLTCENLTKLFSLCISFPLIVNGINNAYCGKLFCISSFFPSVAHMCSQSPTVNEWMNEWMNHALSQSYHPVPTWSNFLLKVMPTDALWLNRLPVPLFSHFAPPNQFSQESVLGHVQRAFPYF